MSDGPNLNPDDEVIFMENGDVLVYSLELGREGLDEILNEYKIVPCNLHRDIVVDKLHTSCIQWIRSVTSQLADELDGKPPSEEGGCGSMG